MKRTNVISSNIKSIGYDEESQILEVEFKDGIYHYFDLPKEVYGALMNARPPVYSHGKYLDRHIKGKYRYKKIG